MKLSEKINIVQSKIYKEEIELDDDGSAIVRINITNAESLMSVYNDAGKEIISTDTAEFINNVTKPIPVKQNIHLKISCDEYTKDKEECYKTAISNYYVNEFAHIDAKLRSNLSHSVALLIIGIIAFTCLYFLGKINVPDIIYLLFEVFSWVFVWEAVDNLWIRRHELRTKRNKLLQIIFAKITFSSLKDKK